MKKCMIVLLIFTLMFLCCNLAMAQTSYDFSSQDGVNSLFYHDAQGPVLSVPPQIDGLDVTEVYFNDLTSSKYWEIKVVEIPKTVTKISFGRSYALRKLESIVVAQDNPIFCSVDGVLYNKDCTTMIFCPKGKTGKLEMPPTVTGFEVGAMKNGSLSEIVFSDAITNIPNNCCEGLNNLKSITLPKNLKTVRDLAFMNCSQLKMVEFPPTIKGIGRYAFGYVEEWVTYDCLGAVPIKEFAVYGTTTEPQNYAKSGKFTYYDLNVLADTENPLEVGDLSVDRNVDAKDALLVLKYAVKKIDLHTLQIDLADMNEDGAINAKDALEILKYSVGISHEFPVAKPTVTPTDITPTNK